MRRKAERHKRDRRENKEWIGGNMMRRAERQKRERQTDT